MQNAKSLVVHPQARASESARQGAESRSVPRDNSQRFISAFSKGDLLISTRPKSHCGAAPGQLPVAHRVSSELLRRLRRSRLEFQTLRSTEGPVSKPNQPQNHSLREHPLSATPVTCQRQAEDDAAARLRTPPRPPQVSQATGHAQF